MTTVFNDARVLIMLADFANIDGSGKINAIGAGFNQTLIEPQTGATPPLCLVAVIDVPKKHSGTEFVTNVELRRDSDNAVVDLPGPAGRQAMRVSQTLRVEQPQIAMPNAEAPVNMMFRAQFVMNFANGLGLEPGVSYRWRLDIDGQSRPQWNALFHVLRPLPGPMFGGPSAPLEAGMPQYEVDVDDVDET